MAEDLEKKNKNEDADEFIEVELIKPNEALKLVEENIIKDAKTIIGILYFVSCIELRSEYIVTKKEKFRRI